MPVRFDPQSAGEDPNLNDDMLRVRWAAGRGQQQFVPATRRAFGIAEVLAGTVDIGKLPIPVPAVLSGIIFLILWSLVNQRTHWGIIGYNQLGSIVGWVLIAVGSVALFLLAKLTDPDPKAKPGMGQILGVFAVFLPAIVNPFSTDTGLWLTWTIVGTLLVVAIHFAWVRVSSGDLNQSIVYIAMFLLFIIVIWIYAFFVAFIANTVGTGRIQGPVNVQEYNQLQDELNRQREPYRPTPLAPSSDPFKRPTPTVAPGVEPQIVAPTAAPTPTPDCVKQHGPGWIWDGVRCVH